PTTVVVLHPPPTTSPLAPYTPLFRSKTWLVDDLLIKADRMSMACSIELRVPFLDHRLVEFAAKLPAQFKIAGRKTKRILKEALADRTSTRLNSSHVKISYAVFCLKKK